MNWLKINDDVFRIFSIWSFMHFWISDEWNQLFLPTVVKERKNEDLITLVAILKRLSEQIKSFISFLVQHWRFNEKR